ncbi:MAG: hypothetical protein V3W34_06990, partial [Phycisphaerae bacterium]
HPLWVAAPALGATHKGWRYIMDRSKRLNRQAFQGWGAGITRQGKLTLEFSPPRPDGMGHPPECVPPRHEIAA